MSSRLAMQRRLWDITIWSCVHNSSYVGPERSLRFLGLSVYWQNARLSAHTNPAQGGLRNTVYAKSGCCERGEKIWRSQNSVNDRQPTPRSLSSDPKIRSPVNHRPALLKNAPSLYASRTSKSTGRRTPTESAPCKSKWGKEASSNQSCA